jgi:hypothetical protein
MNQFDDIIDFLFLDERNKTMHKVFISYHHRNDQDYKNALLEMNARYSLFLDYSVDVGDVSDTLDDEAIREKIRDEYLRDSTVTIVLVGTQTKERKHVDWEIYSSMFDGKVNKKSGVLVVNLPSVDRSHYTATHEGERERLYPERKWEIITTRSEYERRYPHMPARIIDNLLAGGVAISVTGWSKIENQPDNLRFLIEATYNDRTTCDYDLSRAMKRRDG